MKRELLKHVVVKAGSGIYEHPALARHAKTHAEESLCRIALVAQVLRGHRRVEQHRAQRIEQEVVIDLVAYAHPQSPWIRSRHRAVGQQLIDELFGLVHGDEEKVRVGAKRLQSQCLELTGESIAFEKRARDIEWRRNRGESQCCRQRGHRQGRLARGNGGNQLRVG